MDLITFSCKFGIGDEEYLTYYFGENCLLYSILKFYSLLDSHVTKAHTDANKIKYTIMTTCLLYTSPSPRDLSTSRMPSSA